MLHILAHTVILIIISVPSQASTLKYSSTLKQLSIVAAEACHNRVF